MDGVRSSTLDSEIPNEHDTAFDDLIQITDEALRCGALFEAMQERLEGPENRALGSITEVVFEEPDLPEERAVALDELGDTPLRTTRRMGRKHGGPLLTSRLWSGREAGCSPKKSPSRLYFIPNRSYIALRVILGPII